jgi:hypothetical protein
VTQRFATARAAPSPRASIRHVLDAMCSTPCARRHVLDAVARRYALDAMCATNVRSTLRARRCGSTPRARRHVLDAMCSTPCARRHVLDAMCSTERAVDAASSTLW